MNYNLIYKNPKLAKGYIIKEEMNKITKQALLNSAGTVLYVIAVALFMYYGTLIKIGRSNSILVPIALLLLFVLSASVTGYLMLSKPAQMYLDGKKKEALSLLTKTITFFGIFTIVALGLLVAFTR